MSPCTTASPVDCAYRSKKSKHKCGRWWMSNLYREIAATITQNASFCFHVNAYYLLNSCSHVDNILNTVVKEAPGVLEVWRGVLKHHQLRGVIDARQCCPFGIPVHLQREQTFGCDKEQEERAMRAQQSLETRQTHVCGPVSGIIPNIIHQVGEVLQAVGDVMREEQNAHCLHTDTQNTHNLGKETNRSFVFFFLLIWLAGYLWPWFNVGDVHPQPGLHSVSQKVSSLLRSATQFSVTMALLKSTRSECVSGSTVSGIKNICQPFHGFQHSFVTWSDCYWEKLAKAYVSPYIRQYPWLRW